MDEFFIIVLLTVFLSTIIGLILVVKLFIRQRLQQETLDTLLQKFEKHTHHQKQQLRELSKNLETYAQELRQPVQQTPKPEPIHPFQGFITNKEVKTNKAAEFKTKKQPGKHFIKQPPHAAQLQKPQ